MIRTFDLGADKNKEGLGGLARVAPNPALGLRAVRFCLAEPRLFLTQLRAILRASHYGNVRILIPMLASAGEIDQALAMIAQAKESLREQGMPFDPNVPVGGMIEIPAAVLSIGAFLSRLDFLSIGTNDLIQYTLAVDRADEAVSHLYDPLHPAVLKLIGTAIQSAAKASVPIAVCGEMAGDLRLTRLLLGLGLRRVLDASGAHSRGQAARARPPTSPRSGRSSTACGAPTTRSRSWRCSTGSTTSVAADVANAVEQRVRSRCSRRHPATLGPTSAALRAPFVGTPVDPASGRRHNANVMKRRVFLAALSLALPLSVRATSPGVAAPALVAAGRRGTDRRARVAARQGRLRRLLGVVVRAVPALVPVDERDGSRSTARRGSPSSRSTSTASARMPTASSSPRPPTSPIVYDPAGTTPAACAGQGHAELLSRRSRRARSCMVESGFRDDRKAELEERIRAAVGAR